VTTVNNRKRMVLIFVQFCRSWRVDGALNWHDSNGVGRYVQGCVESSVSRRSCNSQAIKIANIVCFFTLSFSICLCVLGVFSLPPQTCPSCSIASSSNHLSPLEHSIDQPVQQFELEDLVFCECICQEKTAKKGNKKTCNLSPCQCATRLSILAITLSSSTVFFSLF
jgi:hypothetical protein